MQLHDLVKPMEEMTDEELMERLRVVRNNRTTVRPAAQARAKKAAKVGGQARINKVESLLKGMSREELLKLLQEGESDGAVTS
jgi:hypothetical protein